MAGYPPFMNAYVLIPKILDKIKDAQTPDRFTQDYLGRTLGFTSGSAKAFISLAKRLGLLSSDGSPTELYKSFRNPNTSTRAMAEAIRNGYPELFERNEKAYELNSTGLEGLVMEVTGLEKGKTSLRSICKTFETLKEYADFKAGVKKPAEGKKHLPEPVEAGIGEVPGLGLSYNINLVLPNTNDVAVFNAIFKSLKENLLR